MLARITDLRLTTLPTFARADGELTVAQSGQDVPYSIARIFTVRAPKGAVRANHAHKLCRQFMICTHGAVEAICDDGENRTSFRLDSGNKALFVPSSLWVSIRFETDSVLLVLCDRPYEQHDYISDHGEFIAWRRQQERR
jgi:UDP-2-acetamido-3-amino-2,3-dideoxy-glucuronate N-acetyltransferase